MVDYFPVIAISESYSAYLKILWRFLDNLFLVPKDSEYQLEGGGSYRLP